MSYWPHHPSLSESVSRKSTRVFQSSCFLPRVCVCLTVGYIRTLSPASLWDVLRRRGTLQLPQMLPRWCGWAQRQGGGIPHPRVVSCLSASLIVRPPHPQVPKPETQPTTDQKSLEKTFQEIPKSKTLIYRAWKLLRQRLRCVCNYLHSVYIVFGVGSHLEMS